MKKLSVLLIVLTMVFSTISIYSPVEATETTVELSADDIVEQIELLPDSMLESDNVAQTYAQALKVQEYYDALSAEEQAQVSNYDKLSELMNYNSDTLNVENVESIDSTLSGKTIGYLGSSITYGYQSDGVSFPDYIEAMTGSTSIKQAITGGPLAKVDGVRDEVSYITQLLEGALTVDTDLDVLVVQLSTNDASLGIEMGEISASYDLDDLDYSTIIGAMEYICAYAKETWDCPVVFYTNPYLTDEYIARYVGESEGDTFDSVKSAYQTTYQQMVDALYELQSKWGFSIIDMWNDEDMTNIDLDLKDYYMVDPIHPSKAGYLFWYTPFIIDGLEAALESDSYVPSIDLTQESDTIYSYDASADGYTCDYSSVVIPTYYVFGGALDETAAEKLLDELGIADNLHDWSAIVKVITPLNGESYTQEDADAFIETLGAGVTNAKVIGIDDGATFVNNYISQECYAIAGIMTYDGDMVEGLDYNVAVPAYLSNATQTAIDYYVQANDASKVSQNVYENSDDSLQRVVVGNDSSLAEAFANAWDTVFSKNYRQHNETTEFYMSSATTQTDPYLLIGIADYDELGIIYNTYYSQPLNGEGEYTWFEYVPEATMDMDNGSVALIVTLHGNGNDARIQGETTGWVELAAEENFIVVSPEWQDSVTDSETGEAGPNFFNCDGLEGDKLIEWIEMLEVKYPQIDTSRIYVTGLSAGGSASSLYGVKYSNVFAAVGAVSAPGLDKEELAEIAETYDGGEVAYMYICGDHDFFGMIPVDGSSTNSFQVGENLYMQMVDPNVSMFSFIQSYQKINGLEVSETYDMSLNEYYGIELENEQWITLGVKDTLEGTLSNENGVIMKFAAIKDQAHWNYKPEAAYMWAFFKNYQRDTETGELIYVNSDSNVDTSTSDTTTSSETTDTNTSNVKTGDSSNMIIPVLCIVSASGIFYYLKKKKEYVK